MPNKKLLAVILTVIVALVGAALAFNFAGRAPAVGSAAVSSASGTPDTQIHTPPASTDPPSSSGSESGGSTAIASAPTGSAAPSATESSQKNGTTQDPSPTPSDVPVPSASAVVKPKLEVPATATPTATTLPKSVERKPALTGKVPANGTAKGKLVPGFPYNAIPIPDGAHIVDSSVSTQKQNVQAAVNLRTGLSQDKVLSFYESQASKKGWLATRGTTVDGAKTITMGYGKDNVVATARTAGTGATTVAVFGSFVVGK